MAAEGTCTTPTLADLGEGGVLRAILPLMPVGAGALLGPGDDAAVVAAPDGRVVVTTDLLVEGHDFRRDWSSAGDVGWKAAVQNLADVAAMGAVPTGLVVALGAPPSTPLTWVEDFARGLGQACTRYRSGVVGGDLSASEVVVVSVTALGDLQGRGPVRRDGARPGDVVALAGGVGRSAAGLDLLRAARADLLDDALAQEVIAAHRRPAPPLHAGPIAALAGATAMLDLSDGPGVDLARIAAASGVHLRVDGRWVDRCSAVLAPVARMLGDAVLDDAVLSDAVLARRWVLTGGEEHSLVACFPAGVDLPEPFVRIGEVERETPGRARVTVDGVQAVDGGWDHFS